MPDNPVFMARRALDWAHTCIWYAKRARTERVYGWEQQSASDLEAAATWRVSYVHWRDKSRDVS